MSDNVHVIERALHPRYYIQADLFEQEKDRIFFRNWLYVLE